MVDKISTTSSNYTPPNTPDVGVSAPIDQGLDWGKLIQVAGKAYGGIKTNQFMAEQEAATTALQREHAINQRIEDVSIARNIMEKQAAGAITEEDTKELQRINTQYGGLKAAVEQGRQTQKGFELRAQALLRESIKRRPDLADDLNKMYSTAVGTPSLEMLQHRYFAEDLDWVGRAAEAKKGASAADASRLIGDYTEVAKLLPYEDQQVILAAVASAVSASADPNLGPEEAIRRLKDPGATAVLERGVGGEMQKFVDITRPTIGFEEKLAVLQRDAGTYSPNSPQWNEIISNAQVWKTTYASENIALANLKTPAAKAKIDQNIRNMEILDRVIAGRDSPEKVQSWLDAKTALSIREIPMEAQPILSEFLKDFSKEYQAPVAKSLQAGLLAVQNGSHNLYQYNANPPDPKSFQLVAMQLARNPKGEKMSASERSGAAMLMTGMLATWGYPVMDDAGRAVPRSLADYVDPRSGILPSIATMIPAMNDTYMNAEVAKNSPRTFNNTLMFMAGVVDETTRAAQKQLQNEGLGQFVKRSVTMNLAKQGAAIDWDKTLQIVGNPNAEQRQRIEQVYGIVNTNARPVQEAFNSYRRVYNTAKKGTP